MGIIDLQIRFYSEKKEKVAVSVLTTESREETRKQ